MDTSHRSSRSTRPALGLALAGLVALAACGQHAGSQGQGLSADAALTLAAPDVYLRVDAFQIPANTFGNPAPITMWGFVATDSSFTPLAGAVPQVPGPTLVAVEGTTLNIHVRNNLLGQPYSEPVSLVIPGQRARMTPVWFDPATRAVTSSTTGLRPAGDTTSRVRSFNTETPADNSTVTTYTFPNLKAGTFLYESGTHPAVQVQMGLYGPLKVYPATAGRAYGAASSAFDSELTLLFSEIDPDLHNAIECGNYGPNPSSVLQATNPDCPATPPPPTTSTVEYHPRYFLINGRPFAPAVPPLPGGQPNHPLLLRFLNAGLSTKVPTVLSLASSTTAAPLFMSVIAEDGNFITVTSSAGAVVAAPRQQYSVLLPAGKTIDAILTPDRPGIIPVFDRRMNLTNAGKAPGGQLVYVAVPGKAAAGALTASPSSIDFGSIAHGTTRTRQVSVQNSSGSARVITAVQIGGPQAASFSVTWSGPITVAGGATITLNVSFTPPTAGAYAAPLAISTDDPTQPLLVVSLAGTGT